jgi:hypothetical protein
LKSQEIFMKLKKLKNKYLQVMVAKEEPQNQQQAVTAAMVDKAANALQVAMEVMVATPAMQDQVETEVNFFILCSLSLSELTKITLLSCSLQVTVEKEVIRSQQLAETVAMVDKEANAVQVEMAETVVTPAMEDQVEMEVSFLFFLFHFELTKIVIFFLFTLGDGGKGGTKKSATGGDGGDGGQGGKRGPGGDGGDGGNAGYAGPGGDGG